MQITDSNDLLGYLEAQAATGDKQWFGFLQQKIIAITLANQIAANHADKMTPDQIVEYVVELNNQIFQKIISKRI
jgi:N-methylhydantoinase A/oxoprolinase/acetone carboxylase beta subunit